MGPKPQVRVQEDSSAGAGGPGWGSVEKQRCTGRVRPEFVSEGQEAVRGEHSRRLCRARCEGTRKEGRRGGGEPRLSYVRSLALFLGLPGQCPPLSPCHEGSFHLPHLHPVTPFMETSLVSCASTLLSEGLLLPQSPGALGGRGRDLGNKAEDFSGYREHWRGRRLEPTLQAPDLPLQSHSGYRAWSFQNDGDKSEILI